VDSTANTIVVEDLTGELFEALGPEGRPIAGFVIFAFNDSKQANAPTYQTHGTWTSAPSFASNQTTFTDADADDNGGGFASWMIGAILVPDVNIGAPLIITGTTATTLTVAGDARGVAANGTRYIVYAAPFVNPAHGAWQTDPHKGGTRYLWAGYRYQPPQMGFWVDPPGAPALGVYGASTGTNRLGQYYCWNRLYDVNLARWTTPDPVATPWWALTVYVNNEPLQRTDTAGLLDYGGYWEDHGGLYSEATCNELRNALRSVKYDLMRAREFGGDVARLLAIQSNLQALYDVHCEYWDYEQAPPLPPGELPRVTDASGPKSCRAGGVAIPFPIAPGLPGPATVPIPINPAWAGGAAAMGGGALITLGIFAAVYGHHKAVNWDEYERRARELIKEAARNELLRRLKGHCSHKWDECVGEYELSGTSKALAAFLCTKCWVICMNEGAWPPSCKPFPPPAYVDSD